MPTEKLCLTDLTRGDPGLRRIAHGYSTSGNWTRVLQRSANVGWEIAKALPKDAFRSNAPLLRIEGGTDPAPSATRLALYVHYARTGAVSAMVLGQLEALREFGFATVFISNAAFIPPTDWDAVRTLAALVVQRRNIGLDYGAWHDIMPEIRRRWPALDELLLANDSVLGPVHPMQPVFEALRSGGEGLFGLTESIQGGPHLQSYLLLVRGRAAIADVMDFCQRMTISQSKWLIVQRGEIRLAKWMRQRGHRVAALFGYDRVARAAAADPAERARLMTSHEKLQGLDHMPPDQAEALLHQWPLNPTQHLWHVLLTKFADPFVKTELIRNNPGRLPGVDQWEAAIPLNSPCPLPVLKAHLAAIAAR